MDTIFWILAATIADSLVALVGIFSLMLNKEALQKLLLALVGFSAGALLSGAFFHLLAEALEQMPVMLAFAYLFVGFVVFFIIERILHWHHCHEGKCDVHPMSYLVLIGDGIHNFIDGLVIAASFIVGVPFGIITTLLIIGHEVPQELGNFGILVYGGFGRKKALLFSLIAQATCIIGGITGYFISSATSFSLILLPFAAGGFIYIGASDLIPELHKESNMQKAWLSFLLFIAGIAFMAGLKVFFAGA